MEQIGRGPNQYRGGQPPQQGTTGRTPVTPPSGVIQSGAQNRIGRSEKELRPIPDSQIQRGRNRKSAKEPKEKSYWGTGIVGLMIAAGAVLLVGKGCQNYNNSGERTAQTPYASSTSWQNQPKP